MSASQPWFVSERAENLAIVLLTRFQVRVMREAAPADRGLDLRVLVDPDKPGLREFGVELKGTTDIGQFVDHGRARSHIVSASRKNLKGCVFPVALLIFDVTTDDGFFGWLLAPAVTKVGARLVEAETVSLEPASNQRIDAAPSEIRRWYEARPLRAGSEIVSRDLVPKQPPGPDRIMGVMELSEYLHVHPSKIYRLLKRGELPGFKIGNDWRFSSKEIEKSFKEIAKEDSVKGS